MALTAQSCRSQVKTLPHCSFTRPAVRASRSILSAKMSVSGQRVSSPHRLQRLLPALRVRSAQHERGLGRRQPGSYIPRSVASSATLGMQNRKTHSGYRRKNMFYIYEYVCCSARRCRTFLRLQPKRRCQRGGISFEFLTGKPRS